MAEFVMIIAQDEAAASKVPQEEFEKVYAWWQQHEQAGRLKAGMGRRLQPSNTAQTVDVKATAARLRDGRAVHRGQGDDRRLWRDRGADAR